MVWYSSSGCEGDRQWKCTYMAWDGSQTWCRDMDGGCPGFDDGGGLVSAVQVRAFSDVRDGGGGW